MGIIVINKGGSNLVAVNSGGSRNLNITKMTPARVVFNGGTVSSVFLKPKPAAFTEGVAKVKINTGSYSLEKQNITVSNIADEAEITHSLGTSKLDVTFYDAGGRKNNNIDWQSLDPNTIKVFLPWADNDEPDVFTGDIFIIKRN
jgi:hypothetical protein